MSTDSPTDERNNLHVFDETEDPENIVEKINGEPVYECEDCGNVWNGIQSESCPECQSSYRTKIAEETSIRAKWTMDGAETVDQAIDKFEYRADQLRALKEAGWEIRDPVTDDYAYIRREISTTDS